MHDDAGERKRDLRRLFRAVTTCKFLQTTGCQKGGGTAPRADRSRPVAETTVVGHPAPAALRLKGVWIRRGWCEAP